MPTQPDTAEVAVTEKIRIISRNECSKLTPRGQGTLAYEFGVMDTTGQLFIRIAANSQGGTCSFEWIELAKIEELLNNLEDRSAPFNAKIFQKVFVSKSANNHGYLAAVLKSEKVITATPEQPTQLSVGSFDSMRAELNHLKTEDIDLPDFVAAALKEREARKQQRKAEQVQPSEISKKKGRAKKTGKES